MDFITFCRLHGVLIHYLPPIGVWKRYPTEDKPKHRNGAVKFMGDSGFVQNHALEVTVSFWRPDVPVTIDHAALARQAKMAVQETAFKQLEAAKRAAGILHQCQYAFHPYLKRKGFPEESGNVWLRDGDQVLVIPMRVGSNLVGVQLIDESGSKKFLSGQKTSEAEFVIDNKGPHILCEGYATALSVRMILKSYKRRYTIHVCFSAGNMVKIAARLSGGFVVADNDESGTGERVAKQIGWPYWISDKLGDFNDHHLREGIFRTGQSLLKMLPP